MATAIPLVFGIGGQWLGGKFLAGFVGVKTGALVGGVGGMMLGSLLFPQESPSESLPRVSSYQTQTTLSGSAIPLVYGTRRIAGNIIILGDSHPYTVVHKSGGGGKGILGGGGSVKTTETRYRRSFLIGICEGPASVLRAWKGKEEIETTEFTLFDGLENSNIPTIIGAEYEFAHYKHLCCVWFEEYDLGNTDSVPMFTFEMSSELPSNLLAVCEKDDDDNSGYVFNVNGSHRCNIKAQDKTSYACLWHPNKSFYMTHGNFLVKCNRYGNIDTSFGS